MYVHDPMSRCTCALKYYYSAQCVGVSYLNTGFFASLIGGIAWIAAVDVGRCTHHITTCTCIHVHVHVHVYTNSTGTCT